MWVCLARSNGYVWIDDCPYEAGTRSYVLGESREIRLVAHLRLILENEKCASLKELGLGHLIKEVRCTRQVNQ